eukprot:14158241-Alexandrium_andersonii.AAC.1
MGAPAAARRIPSRLLFLSPASGTGCGPWHPFSGRASGTDGPGARAGGVVGGGPASAVTAQR